MLSSLIFIASMKDSPAEWGAEALRMIRRDYYVAKSKLYSEHSDKKQPAFNWGVGVMLSALNAAARYDPKYKPWLREYADASRVYWNDGGYDVLPAPKPKDRYYDDNAWMALALAETYEVLGDGKYLKWARQALDFALEGKCKDGGIFWRESDRASRNTCSNAPTAAACLALARLCKDESLTEEARAIYSWTYASLRDPADGLYWDAITNSGKLEKTKWTYNTALMIRTAAELGERVGLSQSIEASKSHWLRKGRIHDPGRFSHLLIEAWLIAGQPADIAMAPLGFLFENRDAKGRLPANWGSAEVPSNPEILDQASFVRVCFVLANKKKPSAETSKRP